MIQMILSSRIKLSLILLRSGSCRTSLVESNLSVFAKEDRNDPLNHTKQHQVFVSDIGFSCVSCELVDRSFFYQHEGAPKEN
jgi:hypothetical protein